MSQPKLSKHHQPMLPVLANEPFNRERWLFEPKWEGYRLIAELNSEPHLFLRSGEEADHRYPDLLEELSRPGRHMVLDGIAAVVDDSGVPRYKLLQRWKETGEDKLKYFVFDILELDGQDLKSRPLIERKQFLAEAAGSLSGTAGLMPYVAERGIELFNKAKEQDLEGVIAKDASGEYYSGQKRDVWRKIATRPQQEAVICGFISRPNNDLKFDGLILGVHENKNIEFVGLASKEFGRDEVIWLTKKLRPLAIIKPPFQKSVKSVSHHELVSWVKPKVVCEVKFDGWTPGGEMWHPVFLGLREDKKHTEVVREEEVSSPKEPTPGKTPK